MKKTQSPLHNLSNFFSHVTAFLYYAIKVSPIGRVLTAYPPEGGYWSRPARSKQRRKIRRTMACAMERNILTRCFGGFFNRLNTIGLRSFGILFLIYGFISAGAYVATLTFLPGNIAGWQNLVAGVVALLIGFLLLCPDISLGRALREGMMGGLLVEVFGISDDAMRAAEEKGRGAYVPCALFGLLAALLSFVASPLAILSVAVGLLVICMIFATPESAVILMLLMLPFVGYIPHGRFLLLGLGALLLLSYFAKLLRGNRVFRLEAQDIPVALFMVFLLISAFSVAGGSAPLSALFHLVLALSYFPIVNIIATDRWLTRCRTALIFSATVASVVGIVQFIQGILQLRAASPDAPLAMSDLGAFVTAGFTDATTFAYFLVIALAFAAPALRHAKGVLRILGLICCVPVVSAVVLTWDQSAWFALVITLPVYALVLDRRSCPVLFFGAGALTATWFLLPDTVINSIKRFFTDPWAGAAHGAAGVALLSDLFFKGPAGTVRFFTGLGNGGLAALYPAVNGTGAPFSPTDFNFWFSLICECGIIGAMVPIFILFAALQNAFTALASVDPRRRSDVAYSGITSVAAMIALGFSSYTWYDPAALTVFFAVLALVGAGLRIEREKRCAASMMAEQFNASAECDYYAPVTKSARQKDGKDRK